MKRLSLAILTLLSLACHATAQSLTVMELNCENIFDCVDDSVKQDEDFLPESPRHWTTRRYWKKLDNIGREIVSVNPEELPAIIGLCEVENDSVLTDLTRRSLLRSAGYRYVMTASPDVRGIDVALLYQPSRFRFISADTIGISPIKGQRPTRDILHVCGYTLLTDTLHVFVVHAPSRSGGERATRPYRMAVAKQLVSAIDSLTTHEATPRIIVMGDFNDYCGDAAPSHLIRAARLTDVSCTARGNINGSAGTYRYRGDWHSLDHIFLSESMLPMAGNCFIHDPDFLLEEDRQYGGYHPHRTYNGIRYSADGFSDHLPLVLQISAPTQ